MKRISDEAIRKTLERLVPEKQRVYWFSEWITDFGTELTEVAQAQLEADKKDHELAMKMQEGYLELNKRAEIRKLLEEIDYLIRQPNTTRAKDWVGTFEKGFLALKERYAK